MVGDALVRVDPDQQAFVYADVAVALAEAGLAEQARALIESNLVRWPDEFSVRVHAGDALALLGDLVGAKAHFEAALDLADLADDFEAQAEAIDRLRRIGEHSHSQLQRTRQRRRQAGRRSPTRRKRKR
jgi:tetratricopeptide (TPR) repeat protein